MAVKAFCKGFLHYVPHHTAIVNTTNKIDNHLILNAMNKRIDIKVVNDVTTKKKYVSPEIEVVNLDEQPKLLSASGFGASRSGYGEAAEETWE